MVNRVVLGVVLTGGALGWSCGDAQGPDCRAQQ